MRQRIIKKKANLQFLLLLLYAFNKFDKFSNFSCMRIDYLDRYTMNIGTIEIDLE